MAAPREPSPLPGPREVLAPEVSQQPIITSTEKAILHRDPSAKVDTFPKLGEGSQRLALVQAGGLQGLVSQHYSGDEEQGWMGQYL